MVAYSYWRRGNVGGIYLAGFLVVWVWTSISKTFLQIVRDVREKFSKRKTATSNDIHVEMDKEDEQKNRF